MRPGEYTASQLGTHTSKGLFVSSPKGHMEVTQTLLRCAAAVCDVAPAAQPRGGRQCFCEGSCKFLGVVTQCLKCPPGHPTFQSCTHFQAEPPRWLAAEEQEDGFRLLAGGLQCVTLTKTSAERCS